MSRRRWVLLALGTLLLVAAPLLAACAKEAGPTPAPGEVVKKPLKIHVIIDMTGVYSGVTVPAFEGNTDYVRWLNEQRGGINGHKVELVWADTGNVMERTWSIYNRFKQEKPIFILLYSSPDGEALKATLEKDGIPAYNHGQSDPQVYPPATIYLDGMTYADGFAGAMKWLKGTWKEPRAPKVGLLAIDNAYGRAHLPVGVPWAEKELGIQFVGPEFIPGAPTDTTPQLLKFRDAGVDYIYSSNLWGAAAVVVKDMKKLGMQGKVPIIGFWWFQPDLLVDIVGAETAEGVMIIDYVYSAMQLDQPSIQAVKAIRDLNRAGPLRTSYVKGWRGLEIVLEAMRLAMDEVGFDNLTGAAVKEHGFDKMKDFAGTGLGYPASFPPNDRRSARSAHMLQIQGGKVVSISDWFETPHIVPAEFQSLFK